MEQRRHVLVLAVCLKRLWAEKSRSPPRSPQGPIGSRKRRGADISHCIPVMYKHTHRRRRRKRYLGYSQTYACTSLSTPSASPLPSTHTCRDFCNHSQSPNPHRYKQTHDHASTETLDGITVSATVGEVCCCVSGVSSPLSLRCP